MDNALGCGHMPGLMSEAAVSRAALASGFNPAFRDERSGEVRLCRDAEGCLATSHVLDLVPDYWVSERDRAGRVLALTSGVQAGYLRGIEFWTLADLRHPRHDS